MTRRPLGALAIGLLAALALAADVAARFELTTDITHFMPESADRRLALLSRQLTRSELSRTMIFAIESERADASLAASEAFEAALRDDPRTAGSIDFLESGPAEGFERLVFELYDARRLSFVADDVEAARRRLSDEGLREAFESLRIELGAPLSTLVTRLAPRDPFLTLPRIFERFSGSRASELVVRDGGS